MADINQIITLGIGTPSDVPHFILVGLSINDDVAVIPDVLYTTTRSLTPMRDVSGLTPRRDSRSRVPLRSTLAIDGDA